MIDQRELRIGNYVKIGEKYFKVEEIKNEGISCCLSDSSSGTTRSDNKPGWFENYNGINAIPISPALLKKCGFKFNII
jgi:hypothetical protein